MSPSVKKMVYFVITTSVTKLKNNKSSIFFRLLKHLPEFVSLLQKKNLEGIAHNRLWEYSCVYTGGGGEMDRERERERGGVQR